MRPSYSFYLFKVINMSKLILAYGSESGNAQRLATTLAEQLGAHGFSPTQFGELNAISLNQLDPTDTLLIITSSFGDGEPTGNASNFYEQLLNAQSANPQFAVFGLGDVSYPKFCGFSKEVDELLREKGAIPIAQRVDADTNFQPFFDQWASAIILHFQGNTESLQSLNLQVKAYDENQSFPARITSVKRLDTGDFPVYDIHVDIAGSGMSYRAGDLLYVVPPTNEKTLTRIVDFYGELNDVERAELGRKELRHLGKPLFRALAKLTKNAELKALTKMSASQKLTDYCYGRDIADVLYDYCTPEQLPIADLLDVLSVQLPRAYSIASCGQLSPNTVRLCVRDVAYKRNDISYVGTASHFLAQAESGAVVEVYVRDNPNFHVPENSNSPMILVAAGAGIAPHLGFLEQARKGEVHLFFGDRFSAHDFLYRDELDQYLNNGHLTALHTAFSRDQTEKIYVQDRVREQGESVWELLEKDGEIYVCGNKANLGKSLDDTLRHIAKIYGNMDEAAAEQWLVALRSSGRYHQDLY